MARINIDDLERYDFENAQKGDEVVVVTMNFGKLQSFDICLVKSVSPKKGYVTLDNDLKYSKEGYEYGRGSYNLIYHRVFVANKESREMVDSYKAQKNTAQKIMAQIQEINMERLMKTTNDNCRKLNLVLDEILEEGE